MKVQFLHKQALPPPKLHFIGDFEVVSVAYQICLKGGKPCMYLVPLISWP